MTEGAEGLMKDTVYYLGVDGGGTKTEFALTDAAGNLLGHCVLPGSNPHDCGMDNTCRIFEQGFDTLCKDIPRSKVSLFVGVAGATDPTTDNALNSYLSSAGFAVFGYGGDFYNILSAGLGNEAGLIAIMGTGCVVFGQLPGQDGSLETQRTGGWGHLLDNGGSGWHIGRDALFAALAQHDGSGEATALKAAVEQKLGCTVPEAIPQIYSRDKSFAASFAPLVIGAAEGGDAVARRILEDNMKELARLLACGVRKLPQGRGYRAVLAGGLTRRADLLFPMLYRSLAACGITQQNLELCVLDTAPVYGALLKAGLVRTEQSAQAFLI